MAGCRGVGGKPHRYLRGQCAAIEPAWLLDTNPDLLKRHHYEPAWNARSGRVMAKERVSLFGLTISDGQRVHYAGIDQKTSRQIMIRDGLVSGNVRKPPEFLKHNLKLVADVMELESRTRPSRLIGRRGVYGAVL